MLQRVPLHNRHHISLILKDTKFIMNQSLIDAVVHVIGDIRYDFWNANHIYDLHLARIVPHSVLGWGPTLLS